MYSSEECVDRWAVQHLVKPHAVTASTCKLMEGKHIVIWLSIIILVLNSYEPNVLTFSTGGYLFPAVMTSHLTSPK